jgi:glutamate racemase
LKDIKEQRPDAVILGCTHYPLFKEGIRDILGAEDEDIVDSADAIAEAAQKTLSDMDLLNNKTEKGDFHCFVSDKPQRFQQLAERFLGHSIHRLEIIDWD